jgi:hypothetical protein
MRLFRFLSIVVVGVVLIGVVVLIVVEVANYDDRTSAEIVSDERAEEMSSSGRCPKQPVGDFEEEHDPGIKGEAVPPRPRSALICSWTQEQVRHHKVEFARTERVLRRRRDLDKLTAALNSLPPAQPLPEGEFAFLSEGEYACPSEASFYMLIALRYGGPPEVQLGIAPGFCGGMAILNLEEETEFEASVQLIRLLDDILGLRP